jgi:hypothetical protein
MFDRVKFPGASAMQLAVASAQARSYAMQPDPQRHLVDPVRVTAGEDYIDIDAVVKGHRFFAVKRMLETVSSFIQSMNSGDTSRQAVNAAVSEIFCRAAADASAAAQEPDPYDGALSDDVHLSGGDRAAANFRSAYNEAVAADDPATLARRTDMGR